jgi:hypothetical protein
MSVQALRAALERIAALLVACVARHTALLAVEQGIRGALRRACVTAFPCKGMLLSCPALQTNPHHSHTHTQTALSIKDGRGKVLRAWNRLSRLRCIPRKSLTRATETAPVSLLRCVKFLRILFLTMHLMCLSLFIDAAIDRDAICVRGKPCRPIIIEFIQW